MKISDKGLDLIKTYEGIRLKAYKCPAGVWTIGYGHTVGVAPGQIITLKEATELLRKDIKLFEDNVNTQLDDLTQGQFDALVSFSFNVGIYALNRSTLLNRLREGDIAGAANEFLRWNKAGGRTLLGLVARRKDERRLFMS